MTSNKNENSVSGKPQVLIVVTNHTELGNTGKKTGWYLPEVAHPYYVFKKAKVAKLDFASPKGGLSRVDPSSVTDFAKDEECVQFTKEVLKNRDTNKNNPGEIDTLPLDKINSKDYNVIFFAGGHGTMWDFRDDKNVNKLSKEIYENGGIVSAVCHGPCALLGIKLSNGEYLIKDKLVCGFTNDEEEAVQLTKVMPFLLETEMKKINGKFVSRKNWSENAVLDKRVVTGQNPASAGACAKLILSCFSN